jgi:CBS domain-containing protein
MRNFQHGSADFNGHGRASLFRSGGRSARAGGTALASNEGERLEAAMRAAEIMTTHVEAVPPTLAAEAAWNLMQQKRIHHLVVTEGGEVRGVLSDRDLGGRRGAALRNGAAVENLMTSGVVVAAPDTTVKRLANLMRGHTIGCVPIMDRRRLVGIVTVTDVLELVGRGIDRPARPGRRPLHHRVAHTKVHGATGRW